ncbi:MAG: RidA family protein [Desulfitobacteriaceae bacterium]
MLTKVTTNEAPSAIGPYSQAIKAGNLVFVSGQLPLDPTTGQFPVGDIKVLTTQSIKNLSAILQEAGSDLKNVVKTTVFLKDMNDFAAVNEVYASFFSDPAPARSAVQVAALPKDAAIEIEAIALLPE